MPESCGGKIRRYTTQRRQNLTFPVNIRCEKLMLTIFDRTFVINSSPTHKRKGFHKQVPKHHQKVIENMPKIIIFCVVTRPTEQPQPPKKHAGLARISF